MPRGTRKISKSGWYHIILRGINRQTIFCEEQDFLRYIDTLYKVKEKSGFKLCCYCLMDNHVHMVMQQGQEAIGQSIKRIGTSYVYWYNMKYSRKGHLFQDRYKSQVIENERSLLTVIRYVIQNPVKAGIVNKPDDYPYSSWHDYVGKKSGLTDKDFVIGIVASKNSLLDFIKQTSTETAMDAWDEDKKTDSEVVDIIKKTVKKLPIEVQNMPIVERNQILRQLKNIRGVSIRQIERITGIGRGTIYKA